MVERNLAKVEVASSSLVSRSRFKKNAPERGRFSFATPGAPSPRQRASPGLGIAHGSNVKIEDSPGMTLLCSIRSSTAFEASGVLNATASAATISVVFKPVTRQRQYTVKVVQCSVPGTH